MNFRILALGALALTALVPAAVVTPAAAKTDVHTCIFQPNSDRDGTWCNAFNTMSSIEQDHGLKVVKSGKAAALDYIDEDTRGSSMQR
jgi:hypothetical protein